MNRASPEMLHCLNSPGNLSGNGTDMSVLERQRARLRWQQDQFSPEQQQQQNYFNGDDFNLFSMQHFENLSNGEMGLVNCAVKADPGLENGWHDLGQFGGFGYAGFGIGSAFEMNGGISRTASCPPAVAEEKQRDSVLPGKMSCGVGRESFKKRKADQHQNLKAVAEEELKEKKMKGCSEEGDSKITEQENSNNESKNTTTTTNNNKKKETSADTSKENSKISEVQKPDYIHVRARRGQATDSHSLAERVRREKISERMKYLQDLVPGCNKITGKAGMLDEIINYVQSLQRQVEFLSMKLAAVNPTLDFNIDSLFEKQVFPACASNVPIGVSSKITHPSYLQFNPLDQVVSCSGLEMGINPTTEMALRRTVSTPISIPETFLDSSIFNQIQSSSTWEANLQSLNYGVEFLQGRSTAFPAHQFAGSSEATNLKMEMM